jgi:hypothetical protein
LDYLKTPRHISWLTAASVNKNGKQELCCIKRDVYDPWES